LGDAQRAGRKARLGAVVLVRFPFSDLSQSKLRPAVVLANAGRGDRILCQVTSKPYGDARAIELDESKKPTMYLHLQGSMVVDGGTVDTSKLLNLIIFVAVGLIRVGSWSQSFLCTQIRIA
jgi:hypothetical protein